MLLQSIPWELASVPATGKDMGTSALATAELEEQEGPEEGQRQRQLMDTAPAHYGIEPGPHDTVCPVNGALPPGTHHPAVLHVLPSFMSSLFSC